MSSTAACPVCGGNDLRLVVEMEGIPACCNALMESREEAVDSTTGDLRLAYCRECSHFFNIAFDSALISYTTDYETSLHFSARFDDYATKLAERLIATYGLRGKDIVEVGCGRGDFIKMLCRLGGNRGLGFDRSYEPGSGGCEDQAGVEFVQDDFGADHPRVPVDFLVCRHVLEHIAEPVAFLKDIRRWLGPDSETRLYFEVPNALFTIEQGGVWDLIYEHCGYFTVDSVLTVFQRAGFKPLRWGESFESQYLYIEACIEPDEAAPPAAPTLNRNTLEHSAETFRGRFQQQVAEWHDRITARKPGDASFAVWGGGSKGVTFLNVLDPGDAVQCVVDINPHKQGRFVPGTGHAVVPPEALRLSPPGTVLVMNAVYVAEIRQSLETLGLPAQVVAVQGVQADYLTR